MLSAFLSEVRSLLITARPSVRAPTLPTRTTGLHNRMWLASRTRQVCASGLGPRRGSISIGDVTMAGAGQVNGLARASGGADSTDGKERRACADGAQDDDVVTHGPVDGPLGRYPRFGELAPAEAGGVVQT